MGQTISDGLARVENKVRAIHGLQQTIIEGKVHKALGRRIGLRIDQFQFVAAPDFEAGPSLGADADPINALRRRQRAIGLNGDAELAIMQRADERVIDLKQRLAAGEHAQPITFATDPLGFDRVSEFVRLVVSATSGAVDADEIRIAEAADGARPIGLAPGPKIAPRKTAKDRRFPRLQALALQGEKYLLDRERGHHEFHQMTDRKSTRLNSSHVRTS